MKSLYVLILALSISINCLAPTKGLPVFKLNIPEVANENEINEVICNIKKMNFKNKICYIANKLQIKKEWLLRVINSESGSKTTATNKLSGAIGLIGFLPSTAIALGTTVENLKNMSNVEQLDYVEKYIINITKGKKIHSYQELKLYIMCPTALSRPTSYILGDSTSKIYKWNKQIDINRDGVLTVAEFQRFCQ
jgi:hypothetical protein